MKVFVIITMAVSAVSGACVLKCSSGPQGGSDVTSSCSGQGVSCGEGSGLSCQLSYSTPSPPSQCTFCTCAPPSGN
ncbi:hypothetical protein MCOR25_008324 [Pyricularia grisea]|uniref:Uncharacterized protein n=1 Tax=Pyricularia grisea TaxID=148305 RepID=A0A6P8BGN3_PYRGI|nr:uncharacterized protein PgNI_02061 [Pyricularia grisea]KAI6355119.1 hypothetical protein MCOR25_008324 [Pyricularia grisea]TLD15769.1 hypothetical protein PgNI_02061 [Pyricularia grisea]